MDLASTDISNSPSAGLETYPCMCGATEFAARRVPARDPTTTEVFTYAPCKFCGLERMIQRPTRDRIGSYYPPTYACYAPAAAHAPSLTDQIKDLVYRIYYDPNAVPRPLLRRLLWLVRRRSIMAFRQPASRRVFEFGAGLGTDLATFRSAGWEISGCEPSPEACAVAAGQGIALQNCLAEDAVVSPGTSCVFMNNVFEHLHDPVPILAKVHAALTPDGVLAIVVPNHGSWTSRVFGAAWPGYDAPRHIWGWTPQSISLVLERAGFTLEYIEQSAPISLWGYTLMGANALTPPHPVLHWMGRTKLVARSLVPVGWVAAAAGHADYIRVVAHKN